MAEKIAVLIDSIDDLLEKILQEQEKQKIIIKQLNMVEQPFRLILDKVYIQGKKLVTVASEMNYNYDHMKKMHKIALRKFDNVPPNTTEYHHENMI